MSVKIVKSKSQNNADFNILIKLLDEELNMRYGELQNQYTKYNKIDLIKDVIVIYKDGAAAACGAYKKYSEDTVELKRIFVRKEYRNQGLAKLLVNELERAALQMGYSNAILETGVKQVEAIALYKSQGYKAIENYGEYFGNCNSVCMHKKLSL